MGLILAGIDEAGYGPMLGPLCVAMAVFRVADWALGDPAPDLWARLDGCVCAKPGDKAGRIAVADSKKLKLANDVKTRHPLCHLERGVLSFLRACDGGGVGKEGGRGEVESDAALFEALGVELGGAPWYTGENERLPLSCTAGELAIAANRLCTGLERAGIQILEIRCIAVPEDRFNETVRRAGSKGATTLAAVGEHLRHVRDRWVRAEGGREGGEGGVVRVVCDRLGGRTGYGSVLARELGEPVRVGDESAAVSRYEIGGEVGEGRFGVRFMPEAETAHLPVALASMTAKLVRELAMARFNRYWCSIEPGLKPTAGYTTDARRWLADAAGVLKPEQRAALVRIA